MKKFLWILLIKILILNFSCGSRLIGTSIAQIISKVHIKNFECFDFIVVGSYQTKLLEIFNFVVKNKSYPLTISKYEGTPKSNFLNRSAVLFFDTVASYQDFHSKTIAGNAYPKSLHFLVYIGNVDDEKDFKISSIITEYFKDFSLLRHESFLIDGFDSVKLFTVNIFQKPDCNKWKIKEINRFSKAQKTWQRQDFFSPKFLNFDGCQMVIEAFQNQWLETIVVYDRLKKSGKKVLKEVQGYAPLFIEEMSKSLNFTYIFNPYSGSTRKYYNKSLECEFGMLVSSMRRLNSFKTNGVITYPHNTNDEIILISRFHPYTQLDKIILPFEYEIWVCFIGTILCALTIIVVVKFFKKEVQAFVFGLRIQNPIMNLL